MTALCPIGNVSRELVRKDNQLTFPLHGYPGRSFIRRLYFIYESADDVKDFFGRVSELTVKQGSNILAQWSGMLWSTICVCEETLVAKNRDTGAYRIPIPCHGFTSLSDTSVEVSVTFGNGPYQTEHKRCAVFAQYSSNDPLEGSKTFPYWLPTISEPLAEIPHEKQTLNLELTELRDPSIHSIDVIQFEIPGVPIAVQEGQVLKGTSWADAATLPDDAEVVYAWDHGWDLATFDKILFDSHLPKHLVFSCTFCDWHNVNSQETGLVLGDKQGVWLMMGLQNPREKDEMKNVTLHVNVRVQKYKACDSSK